jgi:hypothetical protein
LLFKHYLCTSEALPNIIGKAKLTPHLREEGRERGKERVSSKERRE